MADERDERMRQIFESFGRIRDKAFAEIERIEEHLGVIFRDHPPNPNKEVMTEADMKVYDESLEDHVRLRTDLIQDLIHDGDYLREYLAILQLEGGMGIRFACGATPEEVHARISLVQNSDPDPDRVYLLYFPEANGIRQGLRIVGSSREEIGGQQ